MPIDMEGTVENIIYTNKINGYTVFLIKTDTKTITAVGYMPGLFEGEKIKAKGSWSSHSEYGEQFKIETHEKTQPDDVDTIEKFLASGLIKGIGPVTAKRIVDKFKEDSLNVLKLRCEELAQIKGISIEKAYSIGQTYSEQTELSNVVIFFQKYGISAAYSVKIFREFGIEAIDKAKENPYLLVDEKFGIGFYTADRMGQNLGMDIMSSSRIMCGIRYALMQAALKGHTNLPYNILCDYTGKLLGINVDTIDDGLASLCVEGKIVEEESGQDSEIYLSSFCQAEKSVCTRLFKIAKLKNIKDRNKLLDRISEIEKLEEIKLADKQKEAVIGAVENGVFIITGGPGTGKTTIIKTILALFKEDKKKTVLAAPTGRAAKRMSEATGHEAKTIHRLLEMGYTVNKDELIFKRNEENPLEQDVLIIDEMSMVDILLMNNLLKAVRQNMKIIMVGDVNQLPSVGPGNVLKDIIQSGMFKTAKLTEIFRQAEKSKIVVNAHKINKGENPTVNEEGTDFFLIKRTSANDIVEVIKDLCVKRLPEKYGYNPIEDIQIITPTRKGEAGVANLNIELQKVLNPEDEVKNQRKAGDFTYREGDKVMQIKNDYDILWRTTDGEEGNGIFNGDTGKVINIDNEKRVLTVLYDGEKEVEYEFAALENINPAYAVTVHKSQGSEFLAVIIPMYPSAPMLMSRNLFYTAITRAKELVVLVGRDNVIVRMVKNNTERHRYTGLLKRLSGFNE